MKSVSNQFLIELGFQPLMRTYLRLKDHWSSEAQALLARQSSEERGLDLVANKKILRRLSPKELEVSLIALDICANEDTKNRWGIVVLESIIAAESDRIRQSCYFFSSYLLENYPQRRVYYMNYILQNPNFYFGTLHGKHRFKEETITSFELLLLSYPYLVLNPKPRRLERKRGYRDHGTLGSDRSRVVKTHSGDWELQLKEKWRKQDLQDLHDLIQGYYA